MADEDLKSLIGALVRRFDEVLPTLATKQDLGRIETRLDRIEDEQRHMKGELHQMKHDLNQVKSDLHQVKDEQRQMKEMLGNVRLKEVARLDGRIDQLAMDVALSRKPAAE